MALNNSHKDVFRYCPIVIKRRTRVKCVSLPTYRTYENAYKLDKYSELGERESAAQVGTLRSRLPPAAILKRGSDPRGFYKEIEILCLRASEQDNLQRASGTLLCSRRRCLVISI
ncbi:hypothetical protein EVAR_81187_1 [Eumeta japonica]|uniref:Uncharacterized protein n=1 Tax=Eumeta variegata TaxID=151549 RepID=A0A4C1ULH6_EUMVA|nr:hypothetical protein EVAR_81187_1 [Eumeta japonica]